MLRLKILLQSNALFLIILLLVFLFAFFRIYIIGYESKYDGSEKHIEGKIISLIKKEDRYDFTILAKEKIRATYFSNDIDLKLGMHIFLEGELKVPLNNTIPNNFNYKRFLNNQKIYYQMKVNKIEIVDDNVNILYKIKNNLYERINNYQSSNYLKMFIIGDRSELDRETYEIYQTNGVAHLLAISGMHINLLIAFLIFFMNKFRFKELIIIVFIIFYALITNYSASILRASVFIILSVLNKKYDFNIKSVNILFLTISILILYNPLIIFHLGFQYSAIVTYGLIINAKKFKKNYFYNILIINFYAFLFSLPITLMNFYEINLLTIINNLIFVPLVSLIVYPLCLITLFIKYLDPILYLIINITENLNNFFDLFKIMIIIPKVSLIFHLFYYVLLIIFVYSKQKKYLIMGLLLIISFKLRFYLDNNTYIYFLDVGQGDSTLIYNKKEVILIDTGGLQNFNISDSTIRFMKSLGVNRIDLLLLTHGDYDHMGEALNIMTKMKVKNVIINKNKVNNLENSVIKTGNVVNEYISSFNMQIFNEDYGENENMSSIITLFNINDYHILLMGDAPVERERWLIRDHELNIDIIRLGHHGSRTSSDYAFLKEIGAKEAIISSGRNNRFNHPHREVVANLEALNIIYYNTQTSGTIKYTFRRNNYLIRQYLP